MQKKLADGNSVSEAAIGSMATVRAFDAGESELREFESCMTQYLNLNIWNLNYELTYMRPIYVVVRYRACVCALSVC